MSDFYKIIIETPDNVVLAKADCRSYILLYVEDGKVFATGQVTPVDLLPILSSLGPSLLQQLLNRGKPTVKEVKP